jgi:hypothetical protein
MKYNELKHRDAKTSIAMNAEKSVDPRILVTMKDIITITATKITNIAF